MKAFTLIEVIVIIAITALALLGLSKLFVTFSSVYGYQQSQVATAGSAGASLNALQLAILPASAVLASTTLAGTVYASATTTLVLELPAINASGGIVAGAKDYVVFYASSTNLYRLVSPHASSVRPAGLTKLSGTLYALSFTYNNASFPQVSAVTADVETRFQYKQQLLASHLREQWYLRNRP